MTGAAASTIRPFTSAAVGVGLIAAGLVVPGVDDPPGTVVLGTLLATAGLWLASGARGALVAGAIVAALASWQVHTARLEAPLFHAPEAVPSTADPVPAPAERAAAAAAGALVRDSLVHQHLPGVSVAVGRGGTIVWAEGFGWRDLATRTPVTPATRFAVGSATAPVLAATTSLALASTGTDDAGVWSPEHVGEPEEDFPGFRMLRDLVFTPLGLVHPQALPGDRATFYVPQSGNDPRRGRRLMAMRDLACCANGRTFASTPVDLLRVAMATHSAPLDGTLAGGTVLSIVTSADGVAVAVASNIAHARTRDLADRVADAFARTPR